MNDVVSPGKPASEHYSDGFRVTRANEFTFDELAHIYNRTREDYIVPMPMNGKRMEEYVRFYDVDLGASLVVYNADGEVAAIGMLGLRGERAWITRLGVIPERRGRHVGQFMMDWLMSNARERGATFIQLEVITGNEPAHSMFKKNGFEHVRDLLVVRRSPSAPSVTAESHEVQRIGPEDIMSVLAERRARASWIDENATFRHLNNLDGVRVRLPNGSSTWGIFRSAVFQVTHMAISDAHSDDDLDLTHALLSVIHTRCKGFDTKLENIPVDSPRWPIFQRFGYVEAFRRIEMVRPL